MYSNGDKVILTTLDCDCDVILIFMLYLYQIFPSKFEECVNE